MAYTRRRFLGIVAAGSIGLAGCGGDGGGEDESPTDTATPTEGMAETPTPTEGMAETPTPTDTTGTTRTPTEEPTATTTASSKTVVEMRNTSFVPLRASIEPGATVEWVNEDGFDHDVTAAQFHDVAADWSFGRTLGDGEATTFTFEEAGVYEYYCTIHGKGNMCGAVLVGDASLDQSLPCEDDGDDDDGGIY